MTQLKQLQETLDASGMAVKGVSLGLNPNVTSEQVAAEINKSLTELGLSDKVVGE